MLSVFVTAAASAQVTTSGMNGTVTDEQGLPLVGATVIAVHTPSGTQYGAVTNKDGRYNLQGLRAGGPYTVTFSYVGYQSVEFPGLDLPLGEGLRQLFLRQGADAEAAGTLTSCTLILLSAVLTTLGWYQKLAAKAGAGSLVPITGFANAVVSAAIEFKAEGRVPGTGAKMFLIAGPVIVYGTLAAVVYGAVLWLLGASAL